MTYPGQQQPSQPMGYTPYAGQPQQHPVYQAQQVYVQQPASPVYVQQPTSPVYVQQPASPVYVQQPQPVYMHHQSHVVMMQQPQQFHLQQPQVVHHTTYVSKPIKSREEEDVDDAVCCLGLTALFAGLMILGSDPKKR